MLRAENGPHLDAGGPKQQLEGRAAGRIDAGVIGDHPDPFADEGRETGRGQDLDPRPDPVRPVAGAKPRHHRFEAGVSPGGQRRRPHGHGRGHGRRGLGPQGFDIALAVGMQAGGENDHKRLRAGIDPHGSAGIAGVTEGTFGERGVEDPAVRRPDVPAEAALRGDAREALRFGHGRDRPGTENTFALNLAAIDEHLGQQGQVVGRGKDAGMTGHPAHAIRGGVGHHAPAQPAPLVVGGGDAGFQGRRRQKRRVLHAQGLEDLTFAENVQRHVRDPVHDLAQRDEIDVAVIETASPEA